MSIHRLHDTIREDLGLLEHFAPNLEPGDVVVLTDGREAVVTARVEAESGPGPLVAMLEVAIARLGSKPMTHVRNSLPDGSSDDPRSRATRGSRNASSSRAG